MVYRSVYPDAVIPTAVSLGHFLLARMAQYGDLVALVDHLTGHCLTYRQVVHQTEAFAAGLQQRGVRKGQGVALLCPNRPEYAVVLLGVALAGGVLTPINPTYTAPEIAHELQVSGATLVVTLRALVKGLPQPPPPLILLDEPTGPTSFTAMLRPAAPLAPVAFAPLRDIAALPFSSGTTARPKGVRLTHANLIANLCQLARPELFDYGPGEAILGLLPFFHSYGLSVVLLGGLMRGAKIVTLPRMDKSALLKALAQHRVVVAHVAPPVVLFLAKHDGVAKHDLSALRDVISGAAPLGQELAEVAVQRLRCTLRQAYGMTEMAPVSHVTPIGVKKYASIGRLVPNMELRVVDLDTGLDVPPGRRGEFLLRGPNVMQGYLNDAEATAATLDSEGWLHTGDVGYIDEDGDCFIVDRCKELLKVRGFQVAPAELEDVLHTHPAVADCGVVGLPVEGDERPVAFVVLHPGHPPSEALQAEILQFVAERTAWYKHLRALTFVAHIPKSAAGKILRRELRAMPPSAKL